MAELSTAPTYGKVRAEVRGGNAYLWGTVSTAEARNEAGELAAKLPGVARVYNNIQVGLYTFQD